MCGICGIVGVPGSMAARCVKTMCDSLAHRGPDDESMVAGPDWAIGHRRLSIIDLSSHARQPFTGNAGNSHLAANGEIYNYLALRKDLLGSGHEFISQSDCEVILHLLEEDGVAGISRLSGMFAFAFVDRNRRQLILCRDRLGIKPLYFRATDTMLVFASEIKALYALGGEFTACAEMAREHLQEYCQYRFVSGTHSLFRDVREVLPGHYVTVCLDTLSVSSHAYWQPGLRQTRGASVCDVAIGNQLKASIQSHLVSDVPLGSQLSGGLDSSLVTAIAVEMVSEPMHTFSVGFAGYEKDESVWAAEVGKHLGTIHHAVPYTERDFLSDLAFCTYLHDEPLNHANSLPMYKLCREARRYVTVLLTGEGADELFGGYSWHRRLWRLAGLGKIAQFRWIGEMARRLAPDRLGAMVPLLGQTPRCMASVASRWNTESEVSAWLSAPGQAVTYRYGLECNMRNPLAAVLDIDLRTYLVSVLQRQDRMSMASGVESRVPFLDHALVELVLKIPVEQLFDGGRGKAVLRRIAQGVIPDAILERPKTGFSLPVGAWLRNARGLGALLPWLHDERADARGVWNMDVVRAMVAGHVEGRANHADALWTILAFEIWARLWMDNIPHEHLKDMILETAAGSR